MWFWDTGIWVRIRMAQRLAQVEALGDLMAQRKRQLPDLTIFFQDDVSTFVFPDDGGGEGADHVTHNDSIFPLPELLRGWCILEHELLWKMSKRRVRGNSWFSHKDPFSLELYCLGLSCRQLSLEPYIQQDKRGSHLVLGERCQVEWLAQAAEYIVKVWHSMSIHWMLNLSHFVQKRVYGGKGVSSPWVPCHEGRCNWDAVHRQNALVEHLFQWILGVINLFRSPLCLALQPQLSYSREFWRTEQKKSGLNGNKYLAINTVS